MSESLEDFILEGEESLAEDNEAPDDQLRKQAQVFEEEEKKAEAKEKGIVTPSPQDEELQ